MTLAIAADLTDAPPAMEASAMSNKLLTATELYMQKYGAQINASIAYLRKRQKYLPECHNFLPRTAAETDVRLTYVEFIESSGNPLLRDTYSFLYQSVADRVRKQ